MKRFKPLLFIPIFLTGLFFGAILSSLQALPEKIYKSLDLFSKVLIIIDKEYVEPVDGQELVYGGIKGMLGTLDPYSVFLTPDVYKELKVDTVGKFGGIGIELTLQNGVLTVVTPIEDSPAARAGIQPGDRILKINGVWTKGMNLADAVRRMRGSKNSKINLTLWRQGVAKTFDVTLMREEIKIKSVKVEKPQSGIGYARITSFQENTVEDLEKNVSAMIKESAGLKGLILDLRNNPGGLLDQAIKISDLFLKSGVIVSTRGRAGEKDVSMATANGPFTNIPLAVLINKGSASAAEIVAGALKDNHRAKLFGMPSFGKGSVQSVVDLGEETGVKLTIARYFTPSGKSIEKTGVSPDYVVEGLPETAPSVPEKTKEDPQRKAAFEYLVSGKTPPPVKIKAETLEEEFAE